MKVKSAFTLITLVIGFMIAIQFQTTKEPNIRDTRDIRELRAEVLAEQEKRQDLEQELEQIQSLIEQYEQSAENVGGEVVTVLENQIEEMRAEAGLTEITGGGIEITIRSLYNDQYVGHDRFMPSSEVFRFLINELNIYGAKEIAVGNERIITTSAFRDVNQMTYLNNRRLPPLPLKVKVLAHDPERLHNHMVVSASVDFLRLKGMK
ncbi:DUF881 domain-containing protein [Bacillus sp. JCM 19034]|uniref:DUF881 domain-containing protein n=1 Tax=Bacillus sp. JCM 19034 TaxID=1481928 RepID=UPI000ADB308D|nr:DUF881 domain-containing protein [Bacillus sp. JCM 19034]